MFQEKLQELSNQELKASSKSINQTQRNQLMNELLDSLLKDLTKDYEIEDNIFTDKSNLIRIARIDKAIEISVDNEKIGFIPIKISVALPNFDTEEDIFTRVEDYQIKLKDKAKKEKEKAELKEIKIKADTERRKKLQELREKAEK